MMRVWGHVLGVGSLLVVGAAVFSACTHNDSTLFVQNVLMPQQVSNNAACIYTTSPSQLYISSGVLDLDFRREYDPEYLIGSQMVPVGNSQQLVTETSTVTLRGAVVRITDAAGNQLNTFTRLTSGTVYASSGETPGYLPISVTTIDEGTILNDSTIQREVVQAGPRQGLVRLVTYVRFFGYTLGGQYVESDEFEFPVDVCRGCLIVFSPQDINAVFPVPNCVGSTGSTGNTQVPVPCVPGQDLAVDCADCQEVEDCHGAYLGSPVVDAGAG